MIASALLVYSVLPSDKMPPAKDVKAAHAGDGDALSHKVKYLLVGGGTASYNALEAIREMEVDPNVLVIGAEQSLPYQRPPLSKHCWSTVAESPNAVTEDEVIYPGTELKTVEKLADASSGVNYLHGKVQSVDVEGSCVVLADGSRVGYEKLLLATGVAPSPLEAVFSDVPAPVADRIHTFHTLADFKRLSSKVLQGSGSVLIYGGGFLGSELVAALANSVKNLEISQAFPEAGHFEKLFPAYLSKWTSDKISQMGVKVFPRTRVTSVAESGEKSGLLVSATQSPPPAADGKEKGPAMAVSIPANEIIVTDTVSANSSISGLPESCIDVNNGGFLVDSTLCMPDAKNVYAAGDVASYPQDGVHGRLEHHDNAVHQGRIAGVNMTGKGDPLEYTYQPAFWSEIGPDISFQGVGRIDADLVTVGVWAGEETAPQDGRGKTETNTEAYDRGVVFYVGKNRIVQGVLLWNMDPSQESVARRVLSRKKTIDDVPEVSRWFKIFD
ncbi:MAG: hypothetical protein SGCHY_000334 [Lobulomycetales sp.]